MSHAALERRIAELEAARRTDAARNQRRQRAGWALVLGLAALGAAGQKGTLVVKTRRLEIIDEAGRVVLAASSESGTGALQLFNGAGQTVAALRGGGPDGGLHLYDPTGQPLASLATTPNGGLVRLDRTGGAPAGRFGATPMGGAFALSDAEGRPAVELQATQTGGSASLSSAGEPRLALSGDDTGSRADLHGPTGRAALRLNANEESARLTLFGRNDDGAWPSFDVLAHEAGSEWMLGSPDRDATLRARTQVGGGAFTIERADATAFRVESRSGRVGLTLLDPAGQQVYGVSSNPGAPAEYGWDATDAPGPSPVTPEADAARKFAEFKAQKAKERLQSWEPTDPKVLKDPAARARLRAKLKAGAAGGKRGGARAPKRGGGSRKAGKKAGGRRKDG